MGLESLHAELNVSLFIDELRAKVPDNRDPRGRRHCLEFILVGVVAAMLSQCRSLSSIHRFIQAKGNWLRKVTGMPGATTPSRAHLPRMLDAVGRDALNTLIYRFVGVTQEPLGWIAVDGKVLCGSSRDDRQAVVLAVSHATGREVAHCAQSGAKTSEIPVVRQMLKSTGLDACKITLDAGHCNPKTLAQIAAAKGEYVVQVKENQPELLVALRGFANFEKHLAYESKTEKGHGRVTTRNAQLWSLATADLDRRWVPCKLRCLVSVQRETFHVRTQQTTHETSYYISNSKRALSAIQHLGELSNAVRTHWRVESNNWVRDVTFGEDAVRCRAVNQAHVMALLRSLALAVVRLTGASNLRAVLDDFCAIPRKLAAHLREIKFL